MGGSQKGDGRLGEKRRGRKKLRESDVLQEQRCNVRVYARTPPADSLKCQPQIFQSFMAPEVPLRKKHPCGLALAKLPESLPGQSCSDA